MAFSKDPYKRLQHKSQKFDVHDESTAWIEALLKIESS
jgi:hypothetical protein